MIINIIYFTCLLTQGSQVELTLLLESGAAMGSALLHSGSKWLKPAENKFTEDSMWFQEFFQTGFQQVHFPFPVIASCWKFVKLFQV